ncbi:MAG: type II toxin-antitoxin system RelE/ParE family toxin [Gallionellaceae bacterium]|nr:type II toxin-antitoxin system RelE/ParE family toxin [Gallionellaceae bacterium]
MTAVFWLKEALADLRGIHAYIARDNPAAAGRVIKNIRESVDILKEHPGIGRAGRLEGTRELVIRQYPYIVAYRSIDPAVHILAVVHTSRLWPEQLPDVSPHRT